MIHSASSACAVLVFMLAVTALPALPVAPGSEKPVPIAGYREWTQVNSKPHRVISSLASLCRRLTPQEKAEVASDPHTDKFVRIYVNPAARKAMFYQAKPRFPQGSIIVKEKLAKLGSKSPELLTIMYKREKGYNRTSGDWEYLVLDGTGTKLQARGHLENCQSCHAKWKKTDYVSRAYFTDEMKHRFTASDGRGG